MDSLTHIVLGGCIGYAIFPKRLGRLAFFVPAIAATLPDLDIFIRTGDVIRDHLMHRQFMHSLIMVPVLAAIASFPFALFPRWNSLWKPLYLVAFLACLAHPLLDGCTSYGTMMLWPFSHDRISWDLIAVVDLFFTVPLIVGLLLAVGRRSAIPARVALCCAVTYLGVCIWQHARAADAQRTLIADRGQSGTHARVLPQIGAALNYRSIYIADNRIFADAIRVMPFAEPRIRPGSSLPLATPDANALADFNDFSFFSDGYVAMLPDQPGVYADMRYPLTPEGFDALWGVRLDDVPAPEWLSFPRARFVNKLVRDLVSPRDFFPLSRFPATSPH